MSDVVVSERSGEVTSGRRPPVVAAMRRRHLRGVVSIEEATNPHPWSLGLFLGELRMPTSRYYVVALDEHRVVGFCGLMFTGDEGHITNVAVDASLRRQQVATRLMLVVMAHARWRGIRDVTLEVRASNGGAQALYRRFGFAPEGARPRYYTEPTEDAIIMWAHDIGSASFGRRLDEIEASLPTPLRTQGLT